MTDANLLYLPSVRLELNFTLFPAITRRSRARVPPAASTVVHMTGLTPSAKVRRKACTILVTMCRQPPPALIESLSQVFAKVNEILDSPSLADMQRRYNIGRTGLCRLFPPLRMSITAAITLSLHPGTIGALRLS